MQYLVTLSSYFRSYIYNRDNRDNKKLKKIWSLAALCKPNLHELGPLIVMCTDIVMGTNKLSIDEKQKYFKFPKISKFQKS